MGTAALAIQLLMGLLDRAQSIGSLISKAQAEGRDVTQAELDALVAADDAARKALAEAIEQAKQSGG